MQPHEEPLPAEIKKILSSQMLAVLSTERGGQPYSSLMAFAFTSDLKTIIAATGKATRKFVNLRREPRVSLLIDTRTNAAEDFHGAAAITVIGRAAFARREELPELERLYLDKHPYLEGFLASPTTMLFKVEVYHYLLVTRFQKVMEYHLTDETDLFA